MLWSTCLENGLLGRRGASDLVGILNTQHKLAPVVPGKDIVKERHVGCPHMRVSRWRRRNSSANGGLTQVAKIPF